jgi:hypothetical protein
MITESTTLAAAGGVLGLLLSLWSIQLLPSVLEARVPRANGIQIDGLVLAFAAAATMITGILFGLAPAFHALRAPATPMKETRGTGAGGRRIRRAIVAVQTALAVVVLVGAGLLLRSFVALAGSPAGFSPEGLVTFNVQFIALRDVLSKVQAATDLMERLSQTPGIDAAGATTGRPVAT